METLVLIHSSGNQFGEFHCIQIERQLITRLHPFGIFEILQLGLLSIHVLYIITSNVETVPPLY